LESALDFLGGMGAGLIQGVLMLVWLGSSIFVGCWLVDHGRSKFLGWVAGIGTAILLGLLIMPAAGALDSVRCKGAADYQSCVDGDDEPPDWM
jgi:hypothetical protein